MLILDEPTNHLDMQSKDVLKEAIKSFDGTAIIVSHDREFLDGLVTKVYEFGGGKVTEHLGGIYDFLQNKNIDNLDALQTLSNTTGNINKTDEPNPVTSSDKVSYEQHKEQMKQLRKAEKDVKDSEKKIEKMENRLHELDTLLCQTEYASDITLVTEYTDIKKSLDEEIERWEQLSEKLEQLK